MEKHSPIGLFDSGVGGLTVTRELVKLLPHENLIYYADNLHAPYGNKSPETVREFAVEISQLLIDRGVKLIVVACNTATGIAIAHLRERFSIPFIGMEPAVKPAAELSKTGKIGVLATANTFEAEHFKRTKNRFANHVEVLMTVGTGLVELVEAGEADSPRARKLLQKYLLPMQKAGIDQLVLGCTHYPFLIPMIQQILPPDIRIHDPAPAVARQVKRVLEENKLINPNLAQPKYEFLASGDRRTMETILEGLWLEAYGQGEGKVGRAGKDKC